MIIPAVPSCWNLRKVSSTSAGFGKAKKKPPTHLLREKGHTVRGLLLTDHVEEAKISTKERLSVGGAKERKVAYNIDDIERE